MQVPEATAVRWASEPIPCRPAAQDLVDLLKMPTCFGAARKVVLQRIGNRSSRMTEKTARKAL
jgi:hypothetical protein